MGDAGGRVPPSRVSVPSSRFSVPHRELGVPPSRFERLMSRRKRPNSSPNFGEKPLQFSAKTFFIFGFHLILTKKKHFNYRRRHFLVFIQFRRQNYVIFTKVLFSHAKCVWSRLQKRPPMQNFTI